MNTIHLTATEARIKSIDTDINGISTIEIEWGGPDDHTVEDFDLDCLTEGTYKAGGTLTSGWVVITDPCLKQVGDTLPLRLNIGSLEIIGAEKHYGVDGLYIKATFSVERYGETETDTIYPHWPHNLLTEDESIDMDLLREHIINRLS